MSLGVRAPNPPEVSIAHPPTPLWIRVAMRRVALFVVAVATRCQSPLKNLTNQKRCYLMYATPPLHLKWSNHMKQLHAATHTKVTKATKVTQATQVAQATLVTQATHC